MAEACKLAIMVAICLYFQIHQPFRLRRYSAFDSEPEYFDSHLNNQLIHKVARSSYLPSIDLFSQMARRYGEAFRLTLGISGTAIEQFELYYPDVLLQLQGLAKTGCVEFLCEPSHHSLAFLYSPDEFRQQVRLHRHIIKKYFGQNPRVFRNSNLIYSNEVGRMLSSTRVEAAIIEGWEGVLGDHNAPTHVYTGMRENLRLLLRHYRLSEDISMRFSARTWSQWPLMADKYARWLMGLHGDYGLVGLDLENLGERHGEETGIFDFFMALPEYIFALGGSLVTPSQIIDAVKPLREISVPRNIGWTDTHRDLSCWLGNAMQSNAMQELYRLENAIKAGNDEVLLSDWRRLTTSDHFFYMNTRHLGDASTPDFSTYESPFHAYMNFMSILDNLASRARP